MTETVELSAPKELYQGKELRKFSFCSPIRCLAVFAVPIEFDPTGKPKRTVYDAQMDRDVPREILFESGKFETDSPYLILGLINKRDSFEKGGQVKASYRVDTECLPVPAREAWPTANTEGRRAIMLDILKRQEKEEPMDAGIKYLLPNELLRAEEVARRKGEMGDGGEAAMALEKMKVCICGQPKRPESKNCARCYHAAQAQARKDRLPSQDPQSVILGGGEEAGA